MNNTINPPLNPLQGGEIVTVKRKTNVYWKKNIYTEQEIILENKVPFRLRWG